MNERHSLKSLSGDIDGENMTSSSKNRSIAFAPVPPTLSAPARLSGSNLIRHAGIDHVNRFIKSAPHSSGGRGGAKVTGMSEPECRVYSDVCSICDCKIDYRAIEIQIHLGRSGQLSSTLFI